ncbi:MAG: class I SAM-dependent methyltransferase [Sphingomonas sp.]
MERSDKLKRDLATLFYRRPSDLLDMLNQHARLNRWLGSENAPVFADRFALYDHVQTTLIGDRAIDYLEFGVHRGESFARWLDIHRHADSRFAGFDTFTGLPTEWGKYLPQGHFDTGGDTPQTTDRRATFIKGLFQNTLPGFLGSHSGGRQLVIHNDSDLYSSTLYALATLNDRIVPGTILLFDEFASPMHEFRAWNDYCGAFMRQATLVGTAGPYAEQAAFQFV